MSKSVTSIQRASREAKTVVMAPVAVEAARNGGAAPSLAQAADAPDLNDPGLYLNR
jgi:hypothetical protein